MNKDILLLPHIKIQNANALSSPYSIGFPAMTAWLGAVHALERKLNTCGFEVNVDGVAIISHDFNLQTYRGSEDFVSSIIGTSNPLIPKTNRSKKVSNAVRPSFVEEARCHCDVSIIVQYTKADSLEETKFLKQICHLLHSEMKIAGGDILSFSKPSTHLDFSDIRQQLMPGYALIERRDLMSEAMENGLDALDALLAYQTVEYTCASRKKDKNVVWRKQRKSIDNQGQQGWIIPIATGFQGLSPLGGVAKNQRDDASPHRFAESLVTLGQFKMLYRIKTLNELLWRYKAEEEINLYICQQHSSDLDSSRG